MRTTRVVRKAVLTSLVLCSTGLMRHAAGPLAAIRPMQSPAIPDTPAGRQLAGWLLAFNTGDVRVILRFIRNHYSRSVLEKRPADELADRTIAVFRIVRALDLRRIERSTDHELVARVQSRVTEAWFQVTLQVEPVDPYGILQRVLAPAARPEDAAPRGKLSPETIARRLGSYLQKLAAADLFSGNVLVAKEGKPIFKRAYGWANIAMRIPNQIDTRFRLASMGKMFTGVAVGQLAEQGKLSFSDPISKHLPDYPNRQVAEKVTIHHLLTHTSGLGDFLEKKEYHAASARIKAVKEYLPFFAGDPLTFAPGEKWEYSNSGFIVLGAIIEKLSGESYFDYLRERIYRPAEMTHTGINLTDEDVPRLALGYSSESLDSRHQWVRTVVPGKGMGSPAGGGYSTIEDLLEFDIALRRHKLLSEHYTDIVLSRKVDSDWGGGYAYGFGTDQVNGQRVVGHGGDFAGVSTRFDMYLDSGYTVVVLSNYDLPSAENVNDKLREMITQR